MQQYQICNKTCVNYDIKLDANILIRMQSRNDGFDFSATLVTHDTWHVTRDTCHMTHDT